MIALDQIQKRAKKNGLAHFEHLEKGALIHMIQEREGHATCFDTTWCNLCEREDCLWREDCRSVVITF